MATLGDLTIAIKTSGVAEARKQLEALDKLAKSIGEANVKASASAKASGSSVIAPGGKDEVEQVRQMFEARSRMATDFYNADVKAHASALRFMVEQERSAWEKIGQIRRGATVTAGGGGGGGGGNVTPVPSGGAGEANSDFFSRTLSTAMKIKAVEIAAATAAAIGEGMDIGTTGGFLKAAGNIPVIGTGIDLGARIGRSSLPGVGTGQNVAQMNAETAARVGMSNVQSGAFTEAAYKTAIKLADVERVAALEKIKFARLNGDISDENADKEMAAANTLAEAKIKNAKFERELQMRSSSDFISNVKAQASAIDTYLNSGELAQKIATLQAEEDAQVRILAVERKRAANANDSAMVQKIDAEIDAVNALTQKNIELAKVQEARATGLRINAEKAAIAEMQLRMTHQNFAADNLRDEEATAQRIAQITFKGGPRAQEEIQAERDMLAGRKALRARDLSEAKEFMNAETAIQETLNSGAITSLDAKIRTIREKTRQAIIQNPEMEAELKRRGDAEVMTAIRENMSLRSVGTVAANLTAFQGRRRVGEPEMDRGVYKMDGTRGDSVGKIQEKQLSALEKIEQNTRNPVARAG